MYAFVDGDALDYLMQVVVKLQKNIYFPPHFELKKKKPLISIDFPLSMENQWKINGKWMEIAGTIFADVANFA